MSFPEFKPEKGWIKARLDKRSLCACGNIIIMDEIPLGKLYDMDIRTIRGVILGCTGCEEIIPAHLVRVNDGVMVGFMILELFTLNPEEKKI